MTRSNTSFEEIVEFDATTRRREKMKARSRESVSEKKTVDAPVATTVESQQTAPPVERTKSSDTAEELRQILVAFVKENASAPITEIDFDEDIEGEYGVDWFKIGLLFDTLEEKFEFVTPLDRGETSLFTLRRISDYVSARMKSNGTKPAPAAVVVPTRTTAPAKPVAERKMESAALDRKRVESFLINFVVEQTGYPEDVIQMDADLEGDLGINSLKMVNLFAGLGDHFDIKVEPNIETSNFPTLRHVVDYLLKNASLKSSTVSADAELFPTKTPEPAPIAATSAPHAPVASPVAATTAQTALKDEDLEKFLVEFVVEQTGFPEEMVSLDADLEDSLGINSLKMVNLFAGLGDHFDIKVDPNIAVADFPTLRHVKDYLSTHAAPLGEVQETVVAAPVSTSANESRAKIPTDRSLDREEVWQFLVGFVVEQTGFPEDIVQWDSSMESDLGIGSLKIATLLVELSEHYDIAIDPNIDPGDFLTLGDVTEYILKFGKRKI